MLQLQEKTKNGIIVVEDTYNGAKDIAKLEKRLLLSKTKLSTIKSENVKAVKLIDELRRNKMLSLKIFNDLVKILPF